MGQLPYVLLMLQYLKTHLLVSTDQDNRIFEVALYQHSVQLLPSFVYTFSIIAIHNEYNSYSK